MTAYIQTERRQKVQQPRFLVPCTPMQRMPDMLTDQVEAMHRRALEAERRKLLKVIRLLARDLNTSERHYERFEMDHAPTALLTEDEMGNVTVRVES